LFILNAVACAGLAWAQSSAVSTTTSVDVNGHRVQEGPQVTRTTSPGQTVTTEMSQSINGRLVPTERVEERVLRDDASGRVVERVIRRYDSQGNPTAPERQTIEEQKRSDGSSTVQTTTYRGDINGGLQIAQRSVTETRKNGSQETSQTVIQRPTLNGGMDTVEKQSSTTVKDSAGGYQTDSVTYRRGVGGDFYAAKRESIEHSQKGTQSTDRTAEYEVGSSGQLELHSQTVSNTVDQSDGSKSIVVDMFSKNAPGTVSDSPQMKLQEQQVINRKRGANDSVIETICVRRPTVSDPNALGPARQLSETVCRGNCKP